MIISIPPFDEVQQIVGLNDEEKYKASYEYTRIMTDSQGRSESFKSIFLKVRTLVEENEIESGMTAWEYTGEICDKLYIENPKVKTTILGESIRKEMIDSINKFNQNI